MIYFYDNLIISWRTQSGGSIMSSLANVTKAAEETAQFTVMDLGGKRAVMSVPVW